MKRIVSLVLALAMVLSLCIFTTASADDGFVDGKFTKTRHITVEVYNRYNDGGSDPTSSVYAQYIKQGMLDKYNVDVELVSVGRWTEVDDLNNLLATGDAPDVCVTYSYPTIQTFAGMGGIIDLNPLLTEYKDLLPDLWALLGDYNIYYDQDPETGSVWAIEAVLAESARINTFIRKDWLDKLNMAEPTTTEEWVAYLRAAKEAKLGGEQTVPYAMKLYENSPLFSTSVIVDSFLDFSKITKEDWYSLYHEQMPGAKEAYRLLNTLYNEGLISENFAIDNGDIRDRDLNQGYAGFYIEGPTQVWPDYSDEMKKNVGEDAEWIPVNPFVNPDGYTLHENYAANGICIFIPSWVNKETAVAAMKYMDWMAQPENMFYLQNGIEGVHYDHLNEDGLPVGRVTNDNLPDDQKWLSAVDLVFLSNGNSFGNDELNNKYSALAFTGYEDVVARSYEYMAKDSYAPIGFTVSIKAEADYDQMVLAKQAELLTNALTCDPAEFDAVYDRCVQAILDVGGQQIVDERKAAYEAGLIRGDFPM